MTDPNKNHNTEAHVLEVMSTGNIRVAAAGNVDAGKSTLIGTLCHSRLDDGNGSNRKLVTKFIHELESGRTSTNSQHLMAFDKDGDTIVPPRNFGRYTDSYLAEKAHERTVTFLDVAGHERYFKTTIFGLSKGMPDYALVLVNASQGLTYMTNHHLGLCQMCGVPVIIVITKVDAAPPDVLRHTRKLVAESIRTQEAGKKRFVIQKKADIEQVRDKMHALTPLLEVSNVTGEGLDLLREMLRVLPKRRLHEKKINRPFEMLMEEQYNVPGVGLVLSGFVNAGQTKKGDTIYIGPLKNGSFVKTTLKSIHVAQTAVGQVWAGHTACFAVSLTKKERATMTRKKGVVILKEPVAPVLGFTAEICLTKGDSVTMVKGQTQTTMHILHVKQPCRLVGFEILGDQNATDKSGDNNIVLRPGQRAKATFMFLHGPQHIRAKMRAILRDGHVRGIGVIKEVHELM